MILTLEMSFLESEIHIGTLAQSERKVVLGHLSPPHVSRINLTDTLLCQ